MTAARAKAAFAQAETFTPEPPRPLRREVSPAEAFPIEALGDVLGPAAKGIHDRTKAPVAICGQAVLAVAALAVQAHADVQLPTLQVRPTSEFFLSVAETGERKSAVDGHALWPAEKFEETLRTRHETAMQVFANATDAYTTQRERIKRDKKGYPSQEAVRAALDALGLAPKPPIKDMLLCSEPTLEGVERYFAGHGYPSIGVFSAEGGKFIGGHAMRDDAKLHSAASLSDLWDGGKVRRLRAGDGACVLPGRRLSAHLMVQPEIVGSLLFDPLLTKQGLTSRFLTVAPDPTSGTRLWSDPKPESDIAIRHYGAHVLSIFEQALPTTTERPCELRPREISLSPDARETWIRFSDHIERGLLPGGDLEPAKGLANKAAEHAARLAAVLAVVTDPDAEEITAVHLDAGIDLIQHYLSEALRLTEAAAVRSEIDTAQKLLVWLQRDWAKPVISLPDIYQLGPSRIRDKKSALAVVSILEDHGWLNRIDGGTTIDGTFRREAWHIVARGA